MQKAGKFDENDKEKEMYKKEKEKKGKRVGKAAKWVLGGEKEKKG